MTDLEQVARRLFWWKPPSEALEDPIRFLAQVMTYGTIEDLAVARRHFPESAFRDVLAHPPRFPDRFPRLPDDFPPGESRRA